MASTSPPLSVEERFGLLFIVEASSLSASAVLVLLSYLVYSASTIRKGAHQRWRIESPLHYYFLNLMLCDLIQSAGGMLSIRWIVEARVTEGPFCTAQGIMKHVGDVGTALSTLTITVYTFIVLAFRWKPYRRPRSYLVAVVIVWIFIILAVAINIGVNGANRFYGNTGSWCWIAAEYHVQRLVLDYVWMWTAAFFSIVLYVPLYFILRGSFVLEGWALRIPEETKTETLPRSRLALKMLFYPAIYTITVLPIAIVRYSAFAHRDIPLSATVVSDTIFCMSGLFEVILYTVTRPFLLPRHEPPEVLMSIAFSPNYSRPNSAQLSMADIATTDSRSGPLSVPPSFQGRLFDSKEDVVEVKEVRLPSISSSGHMSFQNMV